MIEIFRTIERAGIWRLMHGLPLWLVAAVTIGACLLMLTRGRRQ
jgi:hypothetical protein